MSGVRAKVERRSRKQRVCFIAEEREEGACAYSNSAVRFAKLLDKGGKGAAEGSIDRRDSDGQGSG